MSHLEKVPIDHTFDVEDGPHRLHFEVKLASAPSGRPPGREADEDEASQQQTVLK
eukprot:CAMPEP_0185185744 /NCGR_PEP_ID=MMETSP1140-20130426/3535_1 /TAXON_ID=298111 /ORGANISM="Pavlova sp., Strain CCMP459" /LENGTH=54 /DNA_ID=CAMNT_0027751963 /DNA_START=1211 /DNA_END=1375 /DNA_ORIENTATION=+